MSRIIKYSYLLFLFIFISSCSTSTVEEDMDEYCKCVENANNRMKRKTCRAFAQEIADKFENDPEAAQYIEDHIYDCFSSRRRGVRIKLR